MDVVESKKKQCAKHDELSSVTQYKMGRQHYTIFLYRKKKKNTYKQDANMLCTM